ncbi:Histone-lysine N-methyltransferase SETMAR, partial [Dictyocoela muelleri]
MDMHYSLKRLTLIPVARNTESTIEKRKEYEREFSSLLTENSFESFIFLNEVGFSVTSRIKYGRSIKGTRAYQGIRSVKSKNFSVISVVNSAGVITYVLKDGQINGENFADFLVQVNEKCTIKNIKNPIYIMDNARIHHYSGVKEKIEQLELRVLYLPPYSPFLNIIENVFSKWKNYVKRSAPKTEEELFSFINQGYSMITESDCNGFFRKMPGYM